MTTIVPERTVIEAAWAGFRQWAEGADEDALRRILIPLWTALNKLDPGRASKIYAMRNRFDRDALHNIREAAFVERAKRQAKRSQDRGVRG
mgnify:FL=1